MAKAVGWVRDAVIETLQNSPEPLSAMTLAAAAFHNVKVGSAGRDCCVVSASEYSSIRRILNILCQRGIVYFVTDASLVRRKLWALAVTEPVISERPEPARIPVLAR